MTTTLILLIIAIAIILFIVGIYNNLVRLQNYVKNGWSQIDVQLQRRYDLIPNLVESVKGYMAHERGTLEAVTNARNQAAKIRESLAGSAPNQEGIKDLLAAETALKGAMTNIFALAENYPQLRASDNMLRLQEELSSTENKVAFARQSYNDYAMQYNTVQKQFPAVLVASLFGHQEAGLYQVEEAEAKKAVKVKF